MTLNTNRRIPIIALITSAVLILAFQNCQKKLAGASIEDTSTLMTLLKSKSLYYFSLDIQIPNTYDPSNLTLFNGKSIDASRTGCSFSNIEKSESYNLISNQWATISSPSTNEEHGYLVYTNQGWKPESILDQVSYSIIDSSTISFKSEAPYNNLRSGTIHLHSSGNLEGMDVLSYLKRFWSQNIDGLTLNNLIMSLSRPANNSEIVRFSRESKDFTFLFERDQSILYAFEPSPDDDYQLEGIEYIDGKPTLTKLTSFDVDGVLPLVPFESSKGSYTFKTYSNSEFAIWDHSVDYYLVERGTWERKFMFGLEYIVFHAPPEITDSWASYETAIFVKDEILQHGFVVNPESYLSIAFNNEALLNMIEMAKVYPIGSK